MENKDPVRVVQGRLARAAGAAFELLVRDDLLDGGWIVAKWSNNLFTFNKAPFSPRCKLRMGAAKHKFGPQGPLALGTGFPDFVCFDKIVDTTWGYDVIGVESKINGTLTAIEKEKCRWYLKNKIFNKILIAEKTKVKNRIVIKYHDFEEKYGP